VVEAEAAPLATVKVTLLVPDAAPLVETVATAEAPPPGLAISVDGQLVISPDPDGTLQSKVIGNALKLNPLLLLTLIV